MPEATAFPLRCDVLTIATAAVSAMDAKGLLRSQWSDATLTHIEVEWEAEGGMTEEYGFMWGCALYTREFLSIIGTGSER